MSHTPATPIPVPAQVALHLIGHFDLWIPRRCENLRCTLQASHPLISIGLTPYARLPVDAQQPFRG
ncbi:hypothetical protein CF161_09226 [Pseudomonas sp. CF161]|nr:hypothetical protein CF161_09226 [Pseudomonas sp. CF161]